MIWTISYLGTEKTLADWGLCEVRRRLVSQGIDELTFKADGALADSPPLFAHGTALTLWRDRQKDSNGNFTGGVTWFQGFVTQVPRNGSPNAESMDYRVSGPWWYLNNLTFQQAYQNTFLGYAVQGDPTSALYGPANSSHLFLNQGATHNALTKINSGQQIIEALNWALKPFLDAHVTPPFQIGAVTPAVDVPIDEVRDITCAEVIHKMLRWSPDAVAWFDYTTTPPTFNCRRRADMAVVNLDLSGAGIARDFTVNARYDLQSPFVRIFYEVSSNINGQPSLSLANVDTWPLTPPADPQKQFASLQFTVDLQGFSTSSTIAKITCDAISMTDAQWWLGKHPQHKPFDPTNPADAQNTIASFSIDPASFLREANPPQDSHNNPVKDLGYTTELTTGQLTDWMPYKAQRVTIKCKATIVHRNGTAPQEIPLTYQCLSTNAVSGTFSNQTVSAYPEPIPVGLAKAIYDAISVLQFEGQITLQEQDCSGSLSVGSLFNLTGGALAEWATMKAQVQQVSEDLDTGKTHVQFGPPRNLSVGELVDLLRVNRSRLIRSAFSMRPAGMPGDSSANVDLGQNTPEKNSVSGVAPANPHVISSTIDGTGPVITHASSGADCATTWSTPKTSSSTPNPFFGIPSPGSVTIQLSAALGKDVRLRSLPLCLNGVSGTMVFLCSQFVPDTP